MKHKVEKDFLKGQDCKKKESSHGKRGREGVLFSQES